MLQDSVRWKEGGGSFEASNSFSTEQTLPLVYLFQEKNKPVSDKQRILLGLCPRGLP